MDHCNYLCCPVPSIRWRTSGDALATHPDSWLGGQCLVPTGYCVVDISNKEEALMTKRIDQLDNCPECGVSWVGEEIPEDVQPWYGGHTHTSRLIGIYNMDEVGADTTKRRGKILVFGKDYSRVFQLTPEGDGKMNIHVTACVTTRADGKYYTILYFLILFYNCNLTS